LGRGREGREGLPLTHPEEIEVKLYYFPKSMAIINPTHHMKRLFLGSDHAGFHLK
jgi:hypothetical protein